MRQATSAIVLAAGASTRMGTPKAMLLFRGSTFLSHLCERLAVHCHPVIVVLGANAEAITPPVHAHSIINPEWSRGQCSSLQCGLQALPPETEHIVFTLVDHPDPSHETISALLQSTALIAVPVYKGRNGHPVVFHRSLVPEFLALPATSSAKEIFRRHIADTEYLAVLDPAVIDDIDDPAALTAFRHRTKSA